MKKGIIERNKMLQLSLGSRIYKYFIYNLSRYPFLKYFLGWRVFNMAQIDSFRDERPLHYFNVWGTRIFKCNSPHYPMFKNKWLFKRKFFHLEFSSLQIERILCTLCARRMKSAFYTCILGRWQVWRIHF